MEGLKILPLLVAVVVVGAEKPKGFICLYSKR
jgi:hypothetical protein